MKLPIIQSLWIGSPLSNFEKLCIQSFLDHGHEFHLYVYDEVGGIPSGVTVKSANEILSHNLIFRYSNGSVAGFSNWFRYEMLAKHGGMWVDMDMICLKPFAFGDEFVVGYYDEDPANGVNTAVCGGRNEIWRLLSDSCRDHPKFQPWDSPKIIWRKLRRKLKRKGLDGSPFGQIGGPRPLSEALQYFDLMKLAKPNTYFYPLRVKHWDSIFDETFSGGANFGDDVFGMHLWNEHARRHGYDKNQNFPHGSLFEQLKRKHKITK